MVCGPEVGTLMWSTGGGIARRATIGSSKWCTGLGSASLSASRCLVQARSDGAGAAHLGSFHVEACVVAKEAVGHGMGGKRRGPIRLRARDDVGHDVVERRTGRSV